MTPTLFRVPIVEQSDPAQGCVEFEVGVLGREAEVAGSGTADVGGKHGCGMPVEADGSHCQEKCGRDYGGILRVGRRGGTG